MYRKCHFSVESSIFLHILDKLVTSISVEKQVGCFPCGQMIHKQVLFTYLCRVYCRKLSILSVIFVPINIKVQ